MPTAVSAARQCLAAEAAAALDEGVEVARRRSHAQTTSLHVVSALLSLPSSSSSVLRDALSRVHGAAAYTPRLHFKALELCFFVALDRLPSSNAPPSQAELPPVSNSLMAAIKRSQANQRRNPETFHLYQQQQSQSAGEFSGVKVELQQLILSILDDPVVSRVFCEGGFRSCDIKLAILRPPPPPPSTSILRFPRCPPLFLCSFSTAEDVVAGPVLRRGGFGLPLGRDAMCFDGSGENCRRIGEVLARGKGRSPLLVGAGAADALRDFEELVVRGRPGAMPEELSGIRLLRMGCMDRSWIGRVREALEEGGKGALLSFGDLKAILENNGEEEEMGRVVGEVTRLLGESSGRMWLVGSSATYETYMKFLARFPSVDKDWDLQLLPITSVRAGSACSVPKTNSFMESFVPFGGFLPMSTDSYLSPIKFRPQAFRCLHCNEEYEEELTALLKEQSVKVADSQEVNLPPWMRNVHPTNLANTDMTKAKDSGTVMNEKIADLQKRWNDICQHLHRGGSGLVPDMCVSEHDTFPRMVGFPITTDTQSLLWKNSGTGLVRSFSQSKFPVGVDMENISMTQPSTTVSVISELSNADPFHNQEEQVPKGQTNKDGLQSRSSSHLDLVTHIDLSSPRSASSISTDLVLGSSPRSLCKERNPESHASVSSTGAVSQCIPFHKVSAVSESVSTAPTQFLPYSSWPGSRHLNSTLGMTNWLNCQPDCSSKHQNQCLSSSSLSTPFDPKGFKDFYTSLFEKIRRQEEAIGDISETVTRCRSGNARRNGVWFNFSGPDRVGKKRIAMALAELLFIDRGKFIHVDLSLHDSNPKYSSICDELELVGCDGSSRGKMVVDHIFMEMKNRPRSVLFLENVDLADVLVQSSLSQAIKTGHFSDSQGREISFSNAIVVTTSLEVFKENAVETVIFSEERILAAQKWQLEILIESAYNPMCVNPKPFPSKQSLRYSSREMMPPVSVCVHKRKLHGIDDCEEQKKSSESVKRAHKALGPFLDLNIPFDEATASGIENSSVDRSSTSEKLSAWFEEFLGLVDKKVVFKQFDFDALADNIMKKISKCFQDTIGSGCRLEIDEKVMEQILAATWLLEDTEAISMWLQQVLVTGFIESRDRYNLSSQTILRLVANEDLLMEEEARGIHLPSKIMVS